MKKRKQNSSILSKKILFHTGFIVSVAIAFSFIQFGSLYFNSASAAVDPAGDPTKSSFRVVVCDGPKLPNAELLKKAQDQIDKNAALLKIDTHTYIPCDFNGVMLTIQHLINIAITLGVFVAIVLFTYAGYLMMTGKEADRNKAKDIFPKVFWGFVIMLSAWFIVYQILNWLTGNSNFTKLLGNP